MAFLESMERQVGDPRGPSVPGGGMRASRPAGVVNPPAVNAAPAGRPTNPVQPTSGGAGAALPINTAARPTLPTSAARPSRPNMPVRQPQGAPPQAPQASAAAAPPEPIIQLDRIPTRAEMLDMPPGVQVMTPYGAMGPDGKVTPTPEMQEKYQQAVVARRRAYGPHPFAGDPSAPQPPVALGRAGFNPFTGMWLKE